MFAMCGSEVLGKSKMASERALTITCRIQVENIFVQKKGLNLLLVVFNLKSITETGLLGRFPKRGILPAPEMIDVFFPSLFLQTLNMLSLPWI